MILETVRVHLIIDKGVFIEEGLEKCITDYLKKKGLECFSAHCDFKNGLRELMFVKTRKGG